MKDHEVGPFVEGLRRMFTSLEKLPMPTIAAIEGKSPVFHHCCQVDEVPK